MAFDFDPYEDRMRRSLALPDPNPLPPIPYQGLEDTIIAPPTDYQALDEQAALNFDYPAARKYEEAANAPPVRQKPGVLARIAAVLGGASAGYRQGPLAGMTAAEVALETPYRRAVNDYMLKMQGLRGAADIEERSQANRIRGLVLSRNIKSTEAATAHQQRQDILAGRRQKLTEYLGGARMTPSGEYAPVPEEQLPIIGQAKIELTEAQAEYNRARAEYEAARASGDDTKTALALERLRIAQGNLEARQAWVQSRQYANWLRANQLNADLYGMSGPLVPGPVGPVQSAPLPGVARDPNNPDQPVGLRSPAAKAQNPTAQDKNRRTAADIVLKSARPVMDLIDKNANKFDVWKGSGFVSKLQLMGRAEDPNLAELNQAMESLVQTVAPLHGRNVQVAVEDYRRALPNILNNPETAKAYIRQLSVFSKTVSDDILKRFLTAAGKKTPSTSKTTADELIEKYK